MDVNAESGHQPAREPNLRSHLPALDAVRGLAILMVTVFRFTLGTGEAPPPDSYFSRLLSLGEHGVDLFFVLSGFLITGILVDSKGDEHYFRNFYVRRTLRIFPLYYGVLFLMFVLLPLVSSWGASFYADARSQQLWLWLYGANLLQAKEGAWCLGSFNHFWSLAIEEHYYLVWPLLVFLCSRRITMAICVGLIVGAALLRAAFQAAGVNHVAIEVLTPCRIDAMALGSLVALVVRGPLGVRGLQPYGFWVGLGAGSLLLVLIASERRVFGLVYTLYALFFAALIIHALCAASGSWLGRFWNSSALRFLGKYSYGLYVFQNLLIPLLAPVWSLALIGDIIPSDWGSRFVYAFGMTGITIALALFSWHSYEKHFLRLKTYFEPRGKPPSDQREIGQVSASGAER